ncbi:GH3 auxin-responsive promoter [Chthoniobacter flavus Ellin428]|uniref:GH3 auxin-responsive promoter n=1 Tax=Chthoniobacter flavus Ellin428 TaxID=497964 RepID=B4CXF0_9BACT|nr:GH3 auxin-responsive promoter family protein [Chthoniobacter flavus]EDY20948.1 GH3 auxin-responsive promoter [Chthoniobacter flavus Ellin428]TCO88678.1 GH3 auxin-responsive promoter [Chthoniobacter flavus]
MKAAAALTNGLWLGASTGAWVRYQRALTRPESTQRDVLARLIAINADSAYGRAHGFAKVRSYEDFCRRVPIVDYDTLEPWVTRIRDGESNVLTDEPVARLVPTSGSSGARKLIPFTRGLQRSFNAAIGAWMLDLVRQYPSITWGPAYWSISPAISAGAEESAAVPIGFDDDSAYLGGIRQRLVEATFAAPSALRLAADTDSFRYATLLCLLRQPELRLISVWHPSFLTLLWDALSNGWNELVADVASGDCQCRDAFPAEVQPLLGATPSPRRARVLEAAGPSEIAKLWPGLEVVSCWGDGQAGLPFRDLQKRHPHVAIQAKGLLATEACISIPFAGRHPIAITSHFFEFADAQGNTCLAHALREGEVYTVIVTTAGGLWRYRLGDLVEVDGFVGATPSLRFLGREGGISDLCGEKLAEPFVTHALEEACRRFHLAPRFALLAPEVGENQNRHYTLFIEGDFPAALLPHLDARLRDNPHYAVCRELGQLKPVHGCRIAADAYEIYCRVMSAPGSRIGDIKPRMLSTRTDWRSHFRRNA